VFLLRAFISRVVLFHATLRRKFDVRCEGRTSRVFSAELADDAARLHLYTILNSITSIYYRFVATNCIYTANPQRLTCQDVVFELWL